MGRISDAKDRLMQAARELIWEHSYGATTVDAICARAKVQKGSFYYFFDSKADLAIVAIEADWQEKKVALDRIFSPLVGPMERMTNFFEFIYQFQKSVAEKGGRVLGCPLFTLGCEISTQDDKIRLKVDEILRHYKKYLESAIREAHASGQINAPDSKFKAEILFAYFEGTLNQARIENNIEVLARLVPGSMEVLGVTTLAVA